MQKSSDYPLESHQLETEDGYIITLLRVPYGKNCKKDPESDESPEKLPESKRPAVLLVHGLLGCAESWFLNGPEETLPYILADQGYDCWIASMRGTPLSSEHVSLKPNSRKYWDFSFHEIGEFDITANINYILDVTGNESLYYVGHSMGCAVFFIAMALKPEFRSKIKLMIGVAPAVQMRHVRNKLVRLVPVLGWTLAHFRLFYRMRTPKFVTPVGIAKTLCPPFRNKEKMAARIFRKFSLVSSTFRREQLDKDRARALSPTLPAPTSMKVITHGSQVFYTQKMQQYDYGRAGNIKKYSTPTPPLYDISKVNIPVVMLYSEFDDLITSRDVLKTIDGLPNVIEQKEFKEPRLGHADLLYGKDSNVVFDKILEVFNNFEAVKE